MSDVETVCGTLRDISYPELLKRLHDEQCTGTLTVRHDGIEREGKSPCDLSGQSAGAFTVSYENLNPFVRWYEWGGKSIHPIVTQPENMPSELSPLVAILGDEHHAGEIDWSEEEKQRIYLWLDGNATLANQESADGDLGLNRWHLKAHIYRLTMRLGPERLTRDIRIVQQLLVDTKRAVWLGDGHTEATPPPLRDVERAADRVRALFS